MKKQGFNARETKGALEMWAGVYLIMEVRGVVRFLSDEEARATMEKKLGQPAPKDILDILITAWPIPGKEANEVTMERSMEVGGGDEGRPDKKDKHHDPGEQRGADDNIWPRPEDGRERGAH